MSLVKKTTPFHIQVIDKETAASALKIYAYGRVIKNISGNDYASLVDKKYRENTYKEMVFRFDESHFYSYEETLNQIQELISYLQEEVNNISLEEIYNRYLNICNLIEKEPTNLLIGGEFNWVFKGYIYKVKGNLSDEQIKLLIFEDFDKERRYFEKLKIKFDEVNNDNHKYKRSRIPENVRIEVWRRDGGKCARCGSREKLEYDHIVPISKGGSNTARNIELLCEKHNRSKSNNIV